MTYLMWKAGSGFRIGTSTTYADQRGRPLPGPAIRLNGEHADACWVVSVHENEAEARAAETLLSLRHQLPTLPFVARSYRGSEGRSLVASQRLLDGIFEEMDTETGGRKLLRDQGLSFDFPHFTTATTTSGRRVRQAPHGLSVRRLARFGADAQARALRLRRRGRKGAPRGGLFGQASVRGFRRLASRDRLRGLRAAHRATSKTSKRCSTCSVRFTARLAARDGANKDRNSLPFMPASAVRPGMVMVNDAWASST